MGSCFSTHGTANGSAGAPVMPNAGKAARETSGAHHATSKMVADNGKRVPTPNAQKKSPASAPAAKASSGPPPTATAAPASLPLATPLPAASAEASRVTGPPAARVEHLAAPANFASPAASAPPKEEEGKEHPAVVEVAAGRSVASMGSTAEVATPVSSKETRAFQAEEKQASLHGEGANTAEPEPEPPARNAAANSLPTPERPAMAAAAANSGGEAAEMSPERAPSTAVVEEAPPSPAQDSTDRAARALPADDARVLQRVPPPPPSLSPASTTHHEDAASEGNEKEAVPVEEVAVALPAAPAVEEVKGVIPASLPMASETEGATSNPLLDILRGQQEAKQRYPTALTTEADEDAPLNISLEMDASENVASKDGAELVDEEPEQKQDDGMVDGEDTTALAEPGSVRPTEGTVDTETVCPVVFLYKVLRTADWLAMQASGELVEEEVDEGLALQTAEQVAKSVKSTYGADTPLVLLQCAVEALANDSATDSASGACLRWTTAREKESAATKEMARLHRPLRMSTDVTWFQECADAAAVVQRLRAEVLLMDSSSSETVSDAGEEDGRGEAAEELHPISFTDTSEITRELEEAAADTAPPVQPVVETPTNLSEKADSYARDTRIESDNNADAADELNDDPQLVVQDKVLTMLLSTAPEIEQPSLHMAAAMRAAELEAEVREAVLGATEMKAKAEEAEGPRRVPPPPPPLAAADSPNEANLEATPPPSRPAPPPLFSPPTA